MTRHDMSMKATRIGAKCEYRVGLREREARSNPRIIKEEKGIASCRIARTQSVKHSSVKQSVNHRRVRRYLKMISLLLAVIYLSFISLGLPDALLGSAWPMVYQEFSVPVSYAGIVFGIISVGTIISSLFSDRITKSLGAGKVTAISVAMTAVAMLGFSISGSYVQLMLWAIPYGLGAGSVDACLNNYVALHFKSHHMSWLHCMWGIGASVGPYIMSYALTKGTWRTGYRYIFIIQVVLTLLIVMSIPLWKINSKFQKDSDASKTSEEQYKPLSLKQIVNIKGVKEVMLTFFCYCALEQTAGLWASSYLVLYKGMSEERAARFAGLFFIGITIGRAISGFITFKLNDRQMIRLGQIIIAIGIATLIIPAGSTVSLIGFIIIGLGCAPIYPCIIHSTPMHFGADKSQSIIGVQMASAYVGNVCMPPLFGLIANHISVALLPLYLSTILIIMFVMHEVLVKKTKKD